MAKCGSGLHENDEMLPLYQDSWFTFRLPFLRVIVFLADVAKRPQGAIVDDGFSLPRTNALVFLQWTRAVSAQPPDLSF